MEEHYIKDVGKITYVYGVNLEKHKMVIEKQQKRIAELEKQLAEKDKEIERLKQQNTLLENENGKLAKELIVKNYKEAQKEVSFGIQLAIQELEKVKAKVRDVSGALALCEVEVQIDQQIKELKGE